MIPANDNRVRLWWWRPMVAAFAPVMLVGAIGIAVLTWARQVAGLWKMAR